MLVVYYIILTLHKTGICPLYRYIRKQYLTSYIGIIVVGQQSINLKPFYQNKIKS